MAELKPCPKCKRVPSIGYACGEYFIMSEDDDCPVCGVAGFTEMHSSEAQEILACNRMVVNGIRKKLVELIRSGRMVREGIVELFADYLLANGVTIQQWIPASEPPKEDGRYNVYIADKVHACVDAVRFYKDGVGSLHKNVWARYDCEDGYYEVKHITHWMPLPTPPKGE